MFDVTKIQNSMLVHFWPTASGLQIFSFLQDYLISLQTLFFKNNKLKSDQLLHFLFLSIIFFKFVVCGKNRACSFVSETIMWTQ